MFTTLAINSQQAGFGMPTSGTTRASVCAPVAAAFWPAATAHVSGVSQDLSVSGGFTAVDGAVRKNAYPGTSVWSPPVE